ncbi:hypothetical protein L3X38_041826 [Prunus dulcis]|uniref:Uncharacterized protein n=1 Tax=Prunus dulcis TaxID=3755 RepID=A0AAD4YL97_PRUDU|nr:hypothetical protein L3X38_041826 [Prunus dulcis]
MEDATGLHWNVGGECGQTAWVEDAARLGARDATGTLKLGGRAKAIRATLYYDQMELKRRTRPKLLEELQEFKGHEGHPYIIPKARRSKPKPRILAQDFGRIYGCDRGLKRKEIKQVDNNSEYSKARKKQADQNISINAIPHI